MKSRKMMNREPAHVDRKANTSMSGHKSHGSPASIGGSIGPGPMPGAGELNSPGAGPGPAARRIVGRDRDETPNYPTPTGAAPKGMKIYREE